MNKDLANRINEALLDHAERALRSGNFNAHAVRAERISIIERLISAEYPTVESGLPKAKSDATDVKFVSGHLLAEFIMMQFEGLTARDQAAQSAVVEKFMEQIEGQLTSFKRATREEAFAEYSDGATKADEMLGATLRDK